MDVTPQRGAQLLRVVPGVDEEHRGVGCPWLAGTLEQSVDDPGAVAGPSRQVSGRVPGELGA